MGVLAKASGGMYGPGGGVRVQGEESEQRGALLALLRSHGHVERCNSLAFGTKGEEGGLI